MAAGWTTGLLSGLRLLASTGLVTVGAGPLVRLRPLREVA